MKNREIKFRGLKLDKSEWVYGFYYEHNGKSYISSEDHSDNADSYYNDEVIYLSVCQLIGLKDKNGKEIYEFDIVLCLNPELENTGANDVITFKNASFWLRHRNISIDNWINYSDRDGDDWNGQFELIGNIHENPELLNS